MSNTKDFISKLTELKKNFKIYIPSAGKKVNATQINLKQQKDIISTAVNGVVGALQFSKAINDVIIDNVDGDTFYTFDRIPAILALRQESLGSKIKDSNGNTVSIDDYLSKATNTPKFELTKDVSIDSINVKLKLPTLKDENVVLKKCISEIENLKSESLSDAMGLIYIFEIIKVIESVSVDEEEVVFNDLKVADRVKIIEQLPLELYENITNFLAQVTKYDKKILTNDESSIVVDASLFDATVSA
tara:strand:+ start:1091 stop:1828 length:738 start_codon:yes stop_codon:yes gene_type:complete